MKKFTLLLCLFVVSVMMPQVLWATDFTDTQGGLTVSVSDTTLTIESSAAGLLKTYMESVDNAGHVTTTNKGYMQACKRIVLIGQFNTSDLESLKYNNTENTEGYPGFNAAAVVDMSQAVFPKSIKNYWAKVGYMPSNANDGDKCFVGDLYKLSITSNTEWEACSEVQTDTEYESNSVMDSKKGERNPGDYAKINRYHYYKITTQTRNGWSESMNNRPGNGNPISGTFNEQALPDATNYNKADYLEFEQSRTYFRLEPTLKWAYLNDNSQIDDSNATVVEWDTNNIDNWSTENYSYGDQVKKDNGGYFQYFIVGYGDKNNWSWVEINSNDVTDAIRDAATLQTDKNNHKNDYEANAYIYEATYHYYQVVDTQVKEWDGPSDTPVGNNIIMTPGFTEEQRASNTNYDNEQGVRFFVKTDYYVLVEDQTRIWSIANESTEHVEHFFADDTVRDNDTQANNGDYAIVGSTTEYVWKNNAWGEPSGTVEYDWTQMRFDYWSNSLITAKLPAGVYSTDLYSNNPLNGCTLVTTVQSGNTTATIIRYANYAVAVLDVPSNSSEFTRMKDILEKNNFVKTGEVSSSVGEVGYNSTNNKYTVQGTLNVNDINERIDNNTKWLNIRVLDLKGATEITKEKLQQLTNDSIRYIVLPGNQLKALVCDSTNYYGNDNKPRIDSLRAVISAEGDALVAYVVVPGHLAPARCLATGIKDNQPTMPAIKGLKSVTLAGNLNATDISTQAGDKGLSDERGTITTIDLEKAYFPNYEDMNFRNAGFQGTKGSNECVLKYISLPTTPRMTHIPEDCFRNMWSLDSLCIPFNYEVIHNGALVDCNVEHLTTTDSIGGSVVDHGPLTYTLSANLKQIGDAPDPLVFAGEPRGASEVFPKENGVKEIYSLATKVPICYKNVFSYALTFGYGGQDQEKVYGRDRYFNNGDSKKSFVVLRYPSKEVFDRRKAKGKPCEKDYGTMVALYTDTTKVYTKKDQTGAVDANGNPLLWPGRTEGNRVYNQACAGVLWNDWGKSYSGENGSEINDGDDGTHTNNGSRNMVRRRDNTYEEKDIDLSVGTSSTGVKTNAYTFTPKAHWKDIFHHSNMPVTYDGVTYNQIVIKYSTNTDCFNVFFNNAVLGALSEGDNQTKTIDNINNLETIGDFVVYNDDSDYDWGTNGDNRHITIDSVYFYNTDNQKKLYISFTNRTSEEVTKAKVGTNYTFQPIGNVRNMFQYKPMSLPNDGNDYKKIVVEFDENVPVPAGFNIHAYGERGEFKSLKGKTSIEIPLNGNGDIDDFTIFNWDDGYWTDNLLSTTRPDTIRKVVVKRAYFTTAPVANANDPAKHPDLVDYIGWHQIILTQATYYDPVEKKEGETIKRNYKQTGYCTFCIPYDMTYSQVVKMLGIPASTENVKNYLDGEKDPVATDRMPDIRQLQSVTRTAGSGSDNNSVIFRLSDKLVSGKNVQYLDFEEEEGKVVPKPKDAKNRYEVKADGTLDLTKPKPADKDPRCIVGGRPYIINAYMPYVNAKDSIPLRNLGLYVMTRYADELSDTASCVNNGIEYYEQLSIYEEKESGQKAGGAKVEVKEKDALTMRFAKPYEGHKVQAYDGAEGMAALVYDHEKLDNTIERDKYYYTMVGQFWEQEIPLYAIYMTRKGEWKRYAHDYHIKWDPYKCVIMATPDITTNEFVDSATVVQSLIPDEQTKMQIEADQEHNKKQTLIKPYNYVSTFEHFGGGFRNLANCYFPMNYKDTYDWIPAPMKLWFCGRDDSSFEYLKPNNTRYIFVMEDEDEIIEYGDEVTNVKAIDTLDGVPQLTGKSRVYSLSGQYMGNTTAGLSKGVYIVDGRKIVVE